MMEKSKDTCFSRLWGKCQPEKQQTWISFQGVSKTKVIYLPKKENKEIEANRIKEKVQSSSVQAERLWKLLKSFFLFFGEFSIN